MAIVLGLVTVVSRSPGLIYNGMFDRDESYLAVTGDVLRQGGTLYIDVIDRKPPIVPVLYSMIRDVSVDMRAIRLAVALLIFLNGVVVAEIVRRLAGSRRAALFAGVLSIVGTALFLPADAQAANFELWGLLPASAAILCVVVARSADRSPLLWFLPIASSRTLRLRSRFCSRRSVELKESGARLPPRRPEQLLVRFRFSFSSMVHR
jgi:hypothetical protein